MNKHYKLTQKAISVAISLLTANFVFGIVPLNILPNLSQPVFAQKNPEDIDNCLSFYLPWLRLKSLNTEPGDWPTNYELKD